MNLINSRIIRKIFERDKKYLLCETTIKLSFFLIEHEPYYITNWDF